MVRRCAIVVRTVTIGRPLRSVATTRTTCTSTVAASPQARTTASSTAVDWRVALAVYSYSVCSFSSGSHEHFKDFANAKYLEVGAKILRNKETPKGSLFMVGALGFEPRTLRV